MCGPLAGPPVEMPVRSAENGTHRGQDDEAREEAGEQGDCGHTDAARAAQHPSDQAENIATITVAGLRMMMAICGIVGNHVRSQPKLTVTASSASTLVSP